MDMNLLITISTAVPVVLAALTSAFTFLAKFIKSDKLKKIAEATTQIGNAVLPFIEQAEKFANYSGAEKKAFVITKANQFALENGILFDATSVANKIDELVSLTKTVNQREKDKIEEAL
jgi:hypothetical protein